MTIEGRDDFGFGAFGVDCELLSEAGVRRVSDAEARELLGNSRRLGAMEGIVFPRVNPRTGHPVGYRIRKGAVTDQER